MRFGLTEEGLRAPASSRTGEETEWPMRFNLSLLAVGVKLTKTQTKGNEGQAYCRVQRAFDSHAAGHSAPLPILGCPTLDTLIYLDVFYLGRQRNSPY